LVTPEQTKIFSATCSPPGIPGDSLYQKDLGTGDFIFIEEMKEKHGYDAEVTVPFPLTPLLIAR
jgi:hypothetical protein